MAELSTENLAQGQTTTEQTSEFASLLLQEFKPKTERAREAVEPPCGPSPSMPWSRPA